MNNTNSDTVHQSIQEIFTTNSQENMDLNVKY